jgi:hypothetical protein
MSDFKEDNGQAALDCIEHLLYPISASSLHNVAATLAQECNISVSAFGTSAGYWTYPVLERFLLERGMKCTVCCQNGRWKIDSLHFLNSHPGLIGIIDTVSLKSYVYKNEEWLSEKGEVFHHPKSAVIVHKMWMPLLPFYERGCAFHVTVDDEDYKRYECQPCSGWRVEPVSYEACESAVKYWMKLHRKSQILMSNSQEMVLCSPGKDGWETKTLLLHEGVAVEEASRVVAEIIADKVVERIEQVGQGWSTLAHALFSAFQNLDGHISTNDFTSLTTEEQTILEKYEEGLQECTKAMRDMYKKKDETE